MPETMGWYRACLAIAALLVFWSAPVARAAEPEAVELEEVSGARAAIDDTVAKVLLVLKNGDLSLEEKRIAIEMIARVRFDFYVVSRLVLAKNWKRFSPEQRKVFESEFKIFLAQEYGRRLDDYENQGVEVLGEKPEARGDVTVLTRIMAISLMVFSVRLISWGFSMSMLSVSSRPRYFPLSPEVSRALRTVSINRSLF